MNTNIIIFYRDGRFQWRSQSKSFSIVPQVKPTSTQTVTEERPSSMWGFKWREEILAKEPIIVDLPWFWEYQDRLASYAYRVCKGKLGSVNGKYSCKNMVLTFNGENGRWDKDLQSKCYNTSTNSCAQKGRWDQKEMSFWFCQMHIKNNDYKSMLVFGKRWKDITKEDVDKGRYSERFANPMWQLDMCVDMRNAAMRNGNMPWAAFQHRHKRDKWIKFLSQ